MWDIWPRDSRELLAEFLRRHAHEFDADGLNVDPDNVLHPIHDQARSLLPPSPASGMLSDHDCLCRSVDSEVVLFVCCSADAFSVGSGQWLNA